MAHRKNQALIATLTALPSHRGESASVFDIAQAVGNELGISQDAAVPAVEAALSFLDLLDVLVWNNEKVRIRDQIPTYFCNSLIWYLNNEQKIFVNWNREGTADESVSISTLAERAPYLLKAIEQRREQLIKSLGMEVSATRVQPVSVVLIKGELDGQALFLHQWDQRAKQYQLIGGKKRDNETHLQTAIREFQEEMADHTLVHEKDYSLNLVLESPIVEFDISRTYGSLTKYEVHVYRASINRDDLKTGVSDKWITIPELVARKTKTGEDISSACKNLNSNNPRLLENLPFSVKINAKKERNLWKYFDLNPGAFGMRIRLKRILGRDD